MTETPDPETTRVLMARVFGESLNAAGGFTPDHEDVLELVKRFGITRQEAREAMGYGRGDEDHLPHVWPGTEEN